MRKQPSFIARHPSVLAIAPFLLSACSGTSDAEKPAAPSPSPSGDGGASSGNEGGQGAEGGMSTSGGAGDGGSVSTGGSMNTGGSGGSASSGECASLASVTLAVHIVMQVHWEGTAATTPGQGEIHMWNLARLAADGLTLSGKTFNCGTTLPPFDLNLAGQIVTGGDRVQIDIPNEVWAAPEMPIFDSSGSVSGWEPGETITIDGTVALVGVMLEDPEAPWPDASSELTTVDVDGDAKPGFSAVPRSGDGYVQPPTALGLFGSAPTAERLYLVSRTVTGLDGTFSSCDEMTGAAITPFFDSHIVGCKLEEGGDCSPEQTDFLDQSRSAHIIDSATFSAKKLADDATCADALAAHPL